MSSCSKPTIVATAVLGVLCLVADHATAAQDHSALTGWRTRGSSPEDYDIGVDHEVKHGGSASASIASRASQPAGSGVLLQAFRVDRYRGTRLRMTAFVRSKDVHGWAGLWMRLDGEKKDSLTFDNMENRGIRGTTDWRQYAIVLDVPRDAAELYFGILLNGMGQVWADDFQFEVVRKDVETTGGTGGQTKRTRPRDVRRSESASTPDAYWYAQGQLFRQDLRARGRRQSTESAAVALCAQYPRTLTRCTMLPMAGWSEMRPRVCCN